MTEEEAERIDPDDRLGWRTIAWKFPEGTGTIDDAPHILWRARRYGDRKAPELARIGCVFAVDKCGDSRMATAAEVEDTGRSFRWTVWPYAWETPYDSGYCRSMEAAKRKAEAAMVGWLVDDYDASARWDRTPLVLGRLHDFGVTLPPEARRIMEPPRAPDSDA